MGALIAFYQRSRSHGRSGLALTPTAQLAAAAECRDAKNRTVVVSGTDGPDNQRNMRKTGVCLADAGGPHQLFFLANTRAHRPRRLADLGKRRL